MDVALKALIVWFAILLLAVANGTLREKALIPQFGSAPGLVLSGLILSALILLASYLALPWFGRLAPAQYLYIGFGWLALTLAFEFAFGRLVQRKSWPELLEAYTLKSGNIWLLVLVVTALAPYIAADLRGWR